MRKFAMVFRMDRFVSSCLFWRNFFGGFKLSTLTWAHGNGVVNLESLLFPYYGLHTDNFDNGIRLRLTENIEIMEFYIVFIMIRSNELFEHFRVCRELIKNWQLTECTKVYYSNYMLERS